MNTTGGQNLKEFNNTATAGWLSGFLSAGMMLTNEIEHYICNSEIILKLDKPKKIII
jgi:hypothetical protein